MTRIFLKNKGDIYNPNNMIRLVVLPNFSPKRRFSVCTHFPPFLVISEPIPLRFEKVMCQFNATNLLYVLKDEKWSRIVDLRYNFSFFLKFFRFIWVLFDYLGRKIFTQRFCIFAPLVHVLGFNMVSLDKLWVSLHCMTSRSKSKIFFKNCVLFPLTDSGWYRAQWAKTRIF